MRLHDARDALAMIHTLADDFAAQIASLWQTTVTDRQWAAFLDTHIPLIDPIRGPLTGRSRTLADTRCVVGDPRAERSID